ncbi:MAG: hypothetical protein ACK4K0_12175 [Flavobacteriales bacterium]
MSILNSGVLHAQVEWKSIEGKADKIYADPTGFLYFVQADIINKTDLNGKILYTYSNKVLGPVTSMDIGLPLRPIIFYAEQPALVFTDNTISQQNTKVSYLQDNLPGQITLVANSYFNNSIWAYDRQNFKLLRLNQQLKSEVETQNLAVLLNLKQLDPVSMQEKSDRLYINNPSSGILVFDIFGTYYKNIPEQNITHFQVEGNLLWYLKDNKLFHFDLITFKHSEAALNRFDIIWFSIAKEQLFILNKEKKVLSTSISGLTFK